MKSSRNYVAWFSKEKIKNEEKLAMSQTEIRSFAYWQLMCISFNEVSRLHPTRGTIYLYEDFAFWSRILRFAVRLSEKIWQPPGARRGFLQGKASRCDGDDKSGQEPATFVCRLSRGHILMTYKYTCARGSGPECDSRGLFSAAQILSREQDNGSPLPQAV